MDWSAYKSSLRTTGIPCGNIGIDMSFSQNNLQRECQYGRLFVYFIDIHVYAMTMECSVTRHTAYGECLGSGLLNGTEW